MKPDQSSRAGARFIPTRRTLLSRLKDLEDDASWQRFFDTYWKLIYGVARKAGLTDTEAQDVVQETVIAVARNIGSYRYDPAVCSFKTWLMTVTRSRIANQYRRRRRHAALVEVDDDTTGTAFLERVPDERTLDLGAVWDRAWEENVMDAAIRRVKRRVPAEQFQLFDFNVLRDWPARKVAKTFGVSSARVYLAKHRVSRLIQIEARAIEREFTR
jgi:RNA polymerase sigma factor (sigma-70 family)